MHYMHKEKKDECLPHGVRYHVQVAAEGKRLQVVRTPTGICAKMP